MNRGTLTIRKALSIKLFIAHKAVDLPMPARRRPSDTYSPTDRVPLSFRVRPALKARMEQAVDETGRTLMTEVESKLEWAYDHVDRLGGERVAMLLEALAQTALANFGAGWRDDPDRFFEVEQLWKKMLEDARPPLRQGPRVARPPGEPVTAEPTITAASDSTAEFRPGSAPLDRELMEQLLRLAEQMNRLLRRLVLTNAEDELAQSPTIEAPPAAIPEQAEEQ
jgi:hypothetical protein